MSSSFAFLGNKERQLGRTTVPGSGLSPLTDPAQDLAASRLSLDRGGALLIGSITDSISLAYGYRVFVEHHGPITASYVGDTAHAATGPRRVTTLHPGTTVLVYIHPQSMLTGYIIATLPMPQLASNTAYMDSATYASRQRVDSAHKWALTSPQAGYLTDASGGRLFDALTQGEHGWVTETGLRFFIDSFMFQCAVDEMCGITGFYHDQLLRIAGYNLQVRTAGYEREGFHDQGEYNDTEGWTPYPWEQLGLFHPGVPHIEYTAEEWQKTKPYYGKYEPKDDHMQPWHRTRRFYGYLGQGGKELLQTAPQRGSGEFFVYEGTQNDSAATDPVFTGLFDQFIGLNGHMQLQSAHGFSIVKRLPVLAPARKRRPEQPGGLGDDEDNYKFAGLEGKGPEHPITGELKTEGEFPLLSRAAGILDLHAYLFNYAGIHPFHWHTKDWSVPDESDLEYIDNYGFYVPDVSQLASSMYLSEPPSVKLNIDHRYGEQTYYHNESGIEFLPDGGVVLFDGFGGEIKMTAGHVTISAPGDIWLKSGRSVVQWAGLDAIIRANNSIDQTATHGDIRAVAGGNMQLLSGNGGTGGTLIENRSSGPSYDFTIPGQGTSATGIMFKSRHAQVVTWARDIYLRTGGGNESDEGRVDSGMITLDADRGKHIISTHSQSMYHFLHRGGVVRQVFSNEGEEGVGNEFAGEQNTLHGALVVGATLGVVGDVIAKRSFFSETGHIATKYAADGNTQVFPLQDKPYDEVVYAERLFKRQTDAGTGAAEDGIPSDTLYILFMSQPWYGDYSAGHDNAIGKSDVSLRSLAEYRTTNFAIYEDRWQQMQRLSKNPVTPRWKERPVKWHGQDTYPYPGEANFVGDKLYQQPLNLTEFPKTGKGRSLARKKSESASDPPDLVDAYRNPTYGTPEKKTIKDDYRVVCQVGSTSS